MDDADFLQQARAVTGDVEAISAARTAARRLQNDAAEAALRTSEQALKRAEDVAALRVDVARQTVATDAALATAAQASDVLDATLARWVLAVAGESSAAHAELRRALDFEVECARDNAKW